MSKGTDGACHVECVRWRGTASGVSRAGAGREGGLHAKGKAGVLVMGLSQAIFPVTCRQTQGHRHRDTHHTQAHRLSLCQSFEASS